MDVYSQGGKPDLVKEEKATWTARSTELGCGRDFGNQNCDTVAILFAFLVSKYPALQ